MPFADPNEYFRTHSQQTANISNMRSQRRQDWYATLQPVYDFLKQWQSDTSAMGRQKEGQRFTVEEQIPAETAAQTGLQELMQRLKNESPETLAGVEKTKKETAGMPSGDEASEQRVLDNLYRKAATGAILSAEEQKLQADLERKSRERIAAMQAEGKSTPDNPTEIVWSFLKDNLPVSHSEWVKDANGNWSLESIRSDKARVDQVVKEFEATAGQLYKPADVAKMSAALKTILATGEAPASALEEQAAKMVKDTGVDRGAAVNILKSAYQIVNAPFAAAIDLTSLALFTPAAQQQDKMRNWLNNYFPGRLGDRMYPPKQAVPPAGVVKPPVTKLPGANE